VGVHRAVGEDDENDMSTLTVDVLGTAVAIAAPSPSRAELRAALADLEPASGADRELALTPGDRGLDLRDDGRIVRRGVDPGIAVATIVWRLNAIAAESRAHVLLHAACVAPRYGAGVLLVGGPGAGKSTLAAACLGAGVAYLTDELAAVDRRSGLVVPYAKPLVLDSDPLVPASWLGSVATEPAAPVALVFPRYDRGASLTEVPLDHGWAFLALAAHATNLPALRGPALTWLAGLALACPAVQLTHGDAGAVVAAIEREADGPPRRVEPAEVLPSITDDTTTVALGDSLAVLHEPSGRVHLLNASAAAVWRSAVGAGVDGHDISSLVDAVLERLDAADGQVSCRATALATVDRLVRSGLIAAQAAP
jgi:Coenzyme PQQ synthesis protein D (PqqD)